MTDKQQHEEILEQLDALYEAYSKEVAKAFEKNGYDEYSPKCQRKLQAIADKYAEYIRPLQAQANELAEKISYEIEEERKKQYMTESEYEQLKEKTQIKKKAN